jgi:3-hydroxyisobutyrate dehydrogenase-like beta-hydroxyacid dehydrogenase
MAKNFLAHILQVEPDSRSDLLVLA